LQVFPRTSSSVNDSSPSISPLIGQPVTEMKSVGLSAEAGIGWNTTQAIRLRFG
jgi:hypothetical protein